MPTAIEWCDETFNPWWGCEKVSPGCAHCYAEGVSNHRAGKGLWGAAHEFRFFGDGHWEHPLRWARNLPAKLERRPRVFCASMADVFEDRPELVNPRHRLFELIQDTPELDWLVLTKRPEIARDFFAMYFDDSEFWPAIPANVWMGVSIENMRHAYRADVLRDIPAAVRFVSAEPLLGPLLERMYCPECWDGLPDCSACDGLRWWYTQEGLSLDEIDWVIVGGESGRHARPMHPEWARELREATEMSATAFFFKQWGEWAPSTGDDDVRSGEFHGSRAFVDACLCVEGTQRMERVGKKAAGRDLDGRTWDEFPKSAVVA